MGTRFDMIGIFVSNLKEMVRFYRDILGLEIDWDGQGPYAEFKHEGIRFSMYERRMLPELFGEEPSYPAGKINGTFELAVDFPTYAELDQAFERAVQMGARPVFAPRSEPWGMRSSYILDPDGNLIELGSWGKGEPPQS